MEQIVVQDKKSLLKVLQNLDINKTTEITLLLQSMDDKRHLVKFKTGTVYIINSWANRSFKEEKYWHGRVKRAMSRVRGISEKKLFKA